MGCGYFFAMQVLPKIGTVDFQRLLSPVEVAGFFVYLKKSGEVQLPEFPSARMSFVEGRLVHAKYEALEGDAAAVEIFRLRDTPLSAVIGPRSQTVTVTEDWQKLVARAAEPPQAATEKTVSVATASQVPASQPAGVSATTDATRATASAAPLPDTRKPGHGNPSSGTHTPAASAPAPTTPPISTPPPVSGASAAAVPTTPATAAATPPVAKRPVLRITLRGVSKDFPIIPGKVMTIGRTPDNDICIPDGQISSRHATLELSAKGMCLRDNDSLNGIFMQGKPVKEVWLKPNDQFTLGEIPVTVLLT